MTDPEEKIPDANELRMSIIEARLAEEQKREKVREIERAKLEAFTSDFLRGEVGDKEIALIQRLVLNAAKNGEFEALVYSFPSDLCTDSGRAITNADPNWPETLQGKARQLYERFMANGKQHGYKLKAMIINFPGGMPGDVGFFVNWAPDRI